MEKQTDKVSDGANAPASFPRWREVLHSEISDPSKRNGMEQDIFAWLKFLKVNSRRASVEFVLDYLHHIGEHGQKTDSVRTSLGGFSNPPPTSGGSTISPWMRGFWAAFSARP